MYQQWNIPNNLHLKAKPQNVMECNSHIEKLQKFNGGYIVVQQ